ncbi:hypothetical protein [Azoarcus sp. KH32C]|uniref:hypothetical protein n=1 Tax=Azoarcus sp. KH32C TaxID=748247 RepID=UPI000238641C|nr:hypothetical protein [Azoarcus sp. KH32C]BAL25739.1 hypothetical protein AZKH_3450 [Azoarcus sp. KH32C]
MEISNSLASADLSQLQRTLQPQRPERPPQARAQEAEQADLSVTISDQARAAQQLDATVAASGAAAAETAPPVDAPPRSERADEVHAGAGGNTPPLPPGLAVRAEHASATSPADPAAPRTPSRQPDEATAAGNQAVQLYLANAAQPENRPRTAPIRASA